jgi:hypothetical protein
LKGFDIDEFGTNVVTLARIAVGVLVGQLRTLCSRHGWRRVVFRSNQFNAFFRSAALFLDRSEQLGVDRVPATFKHVGTQK